MPVSYTHLDVYKRQAYKEGFTYDDILEEATRRIQQKSLLTLGGFGGYIVLGFPQSIPNVTGEYDFKIKGNALSLIHI